MDRWRHLKISCALLLLAGVVQVWCLRAAVLPALDAVRFVAEAQKIERDGLRAAVQNGVPRPMFPASIVAVRQGLRAWGYEGTDVWARSAQIAAAIPLVLSVVPVYLLATMLVGSRGATWAGAMYCVLPEVVCLGADGIGDSTHLLWFVLATMMAVAAIGSTTRSAVLYLVSGACMGCALLCRVEAVVLLPALIVATAFSDAGGMRVGRCAHGANWFALGLLMIVGSLGISSGAVAGQLARVHSFWNEESARGNAVPPLVTSPGASDRSSFAPKETSVSSRSLGYGAALRRLSRELPLAYHYWIGVLALYGGWLARGNRRRASDRLLQVLIVLYVAALVHYSARVGYLDSRHLAPLVTVTMGWAGLGLAAAADGLSQRWRRAVVESSFLGGWNSVRRGVAWAVMLGMVVSCLPRTLTPVHASRRGHREAAEWLAQHASACERVLDTRGWTGLYSGRPTYDYAQAREAFLDGALRYVVLEQHELHYDSPRSRRLAELMKAAGTQVGEFGDRQRGAGQMVLLYEWNPERLARHEGAGMLTN